MAPPQNIAVQDVRLLLALAGRRDSVKMKVLLRLGQERRPVPLLEGRRRSLRPSLKFYGGGSWKGNVTVTGHVVYTLPLIKVKPWIADCYEGGPLACVAGGQSLKVRGKPPPNFRLRLNTDGAMHL